MFHGLVRLYKLTTKTQEKHMLVVIMSDTVIVLKIYGLIEIFYKKNIKIG
jgi:hypothetical protein